MASQDRIGFDRNDLLIRAFAAQNLLAQSHPQLERLDIGFEAGSLPVWLVMHEDLRTNARVRRVADFLALALKRYLAGQDPVEPG